MKSYFHHEEIYRKATLDKLKKVHVTVCGAGALGSNLVDNMARQGFRNIRVIDMDRVEKHNINTQVYHRGNIGALKTAALKGLVYQAVEVEIEAEGKELAEDNIKKLFKNTDLVVDCFDNSASRKLVTEYCLNNKLSCLHCGLHEAYAEIIWNEKYKVPENTGGPAPCEIGLARNIVLLAVTVATEEIISFAIGGKKKNYSITLRDLKINVR